jgi:alpha-amylase
VGKRIQLALVIHNHQPVGNFDHVIADASAHAYLPFLRMLLEFPRVRLGLHTSGCLLEWLEQGCPEYFSLVRELLSRGQLELLGGGMYEPILPILPQRNAVWQLQRLNSYLGEHFGAAPRGMWLAERVWEPHLPQAIAAAGLQYTLLDDYHFRGCALPEAVAREYFTTQHGSDHLALFPISEKLRYTLPFQSVEATFTHLAALADGAGGDIPVAIFGDDGEKFGVWPETYEWVYERGWLRDFLTALTEALDWVDLLLPAEVLDRRAPAGEVYIPCCSYKEMGDWTRVDVDAAEADPPGHWRNYLSKYSEAQALYERMLQVAQEADAAQTVAPEAGWHAAVSDDLGRGQCNCAYWHGVFGGLYLNNLRHALNSSLLLAERTLAGQAEQALDADQAYVPNAYGGTALRLRNARLNLQFNAQHGLALDRLDAYNPPFVWSNVLTRRREHYHHKLGVNYVPSAHASIHDRVVVKEDGLQDRLLYDPHPRGNFNTYLAPARATPQQFMLVSAATLARWKRSADDYEVAVTDLQHRAGHVSGRVQLGPCLLCKTAELRGHVVELGIGLEDGELPDGQCLWVEFNFNVLTDQSDDRFLLLDGKRHVLSEGLQLSGLSGFTLCDGWQQRQLRLAASTAAEFIIYPIYTVSSSEGGFERTYQGSCFMLGFAAAALATGINLTLRIEELGHAAG